MIRFTADDLKGYLNDVAEVMEENKEYLCELDRKLGDGDHGITMSIGWRSIQDKLGNELKDEQDCGKILALSARTFLSAVGSSVGPLYATGFLRGAKVLQEKSEATDAELAQFWIAFIEGIKERGQAEVGDKTMIDALQPALVSLKENFDKSGDFVEAFSKAVSSGIEGMESTKNLLSKRGRSSRLGERSLGCQDPGATSASLILSTFLKAVQSSQAV